MAAIAKKKAAWPEGKEEPECSKRKLTLLIAKGLILGKNQRIKLTITNLAKKAAKADSTTILKYFLKSFTKNKNKPKSKKYCRNSAKKIAKTSNHFHLKTN